uniref:Uncharacterized protein n=1 Tax=Triticum urartu TaxID=4572 RepID=A0A8R7U4P7_TRIUA
LNRNINTNCVIPQIQSKASFRCCVLNSSLCLPLPRFDYSLAPAPAPTLSASPFLITPASDACAGQVLPALRR